MGPEISDVETLMSRWSIEELKAFFCCVRSNDSVRVPESREDLIPGCLGELFWAYSSKTIEQATQSADRLKQAIHIKFDELVGAYNDLPRRKKKYAELPDTAELSFTITAPDAPSFKDWLVPRDDRQWLRKRIKRVVDNLTANEMDRSLEEF